MLAFSVRNEIADFLGEFCVVTSLQNFCVFSFWFKPFGERQNELGSKYLATRVAS